MVHAVNSIQVFQQVKEDFQTQKYDRVIWLLTYHGNSFSFAAKCNFNSLLLRGGNQKDIATKFINIAERDVNHLPLEESQTSTLAAPTASEASPAPAAQKTETVSAKVLNKDESKKAPESKEPPSNEQELNEHIETFGLLADVAASSIDQGNKEEFQQVFGNLLGTLTSFEAKMSNIVFQVKNGKFDNELKRLGLRVDFACGYPLMNGPLGRFYLFIMQKTQEDQCVSVEDCQKIAKIKESLEDLRTKM